MMKARLYEPCNFYNGLQQTGMDSTKKESKHPSNTFVFSKGNVLVKFEDRKEGKGHVNTM